MIVKCTTNALYFASIFQSYILVAGCEEYSISGAQVDIFEDIASVTCASSGVTWKMRCVDSQWTGEEGYCGICEHTDNTIQINKRLCCAVIILK